MIVIFRVCLALLAALAIGLGASEARADAGDSPEVEAQRLVHILGYTAGDYGGAVARGVVTNPSEYEEQLALLSDAAKIATKIQAAAPKSDKPVDLSALVAKVRSLVDAKAPEADVVVAVTEAKRAITVAFRLSEAPTSPPDAARGKALYGEHCAGCHGDTGKGDTQRAASLNPRPANFHEEKTAESLSPLRISATVRFGVSGTAMVPFTFLSEGDRWALAFYVAGLRHTASPSSESPSYTLAELAVRTDAEIAGDLEAAGVPPGLRPGVLADLRLRAPYEARAPRSPLATARARLDRAKAALRRGDREAARAATIDAYLDGIEPAEAVLRTADPEIVRSLEQRFLSARAALERDGDLALAEERLDVLLRDTARAEVLLKARSERPSFFSTALSSAGILLREGVEAALLLAALLALAKQAGLEDKRRFVHIGWSVALLLGLATWFAASRVVTLSGASRELIEGVTALLATVVLFYVSYSLIAKKEVARWMKFLRAQVSPRNAALSLFGVAFLAVYREAFETVLFYQALLASGAGALAALAGAAFGAMVLVVFIVAYTRAGRFAPPQLFFRASSYLLYGLAVVFAGQGIAALQLTGALPIHALKMPSVPALGVHATLETCAAQVALLGLALLGFLRSERAEPPGGSAPREGAAA